jgi:hypothetical protein
MKKVKRVSSLKSKEFLPETKKGRMFDELSLEEVNQ